MPHTWEIISGKLWQADFFGALGKPADLKVSCSMLSEGPVLSTDFLLGVKAHLMFPFMDCDQLPDMDTAWCIVAASYQAISIGKTVMVNCNCGRNRSGLIIGMILQAMSIANPVERIQRVHPEALSNQRFVTYLKEGK